MNEDTEKSGQFDIEKLLAEGKTIQIHPQGYSMYPMFLPGRDEAVIAPADPERLKRGDVVLYRRDGSILVLHRLCYRKKDGFYFVGDNQTEVEGPLRPDQMKGVLVAFIRGGRRIRVTNPVYVITSHIWLFLRPVRSWIKAPLAFFKKLLRPGRKA